MFFSDETHASFCVSSSVVNSEAVNYFLSSPLAWCYSDSFVDLGVERLWNMEELLELLVSIKASGIF